jgi:hypothetical protein
MFGYLLILTFLPALLVFGFVKVYKKQLAKNPTRKQYIRYISTYLVFVISIGLVIYGFSKLV